MTARRGRASAVVTVTTIVRSVIIHVVTVGHLVTLTAAISVTVMECVVIVVTLTVTLIVRLKRW